MPSAPDAVPVFSSSIRYRDRAEKAGYIADKYRSILGQSVLDVGCDRAPLRPLVTGRYVGVDITPGAADLVIDLDREALPFADRSFTTVLCTDVLEHLERCHSVFDELCRVADRWVIVSLPNPLRELLRQLSEGEYRLKHYGLPIEPPVDRHRWFFNSVEAEAFVRARALVSGFGVAHMDFEDDRAMTLAGVESAKHPAAARGTLWAVLERAEFARPRT